MLVRHPGATNIVQQVVITGNVHTREYFAHDVWLESRLLGNRSHQAQTEQRCLDVVIGAQVVEQDSRPGERIGAAEPDRAASVRPEVDGGQGKARERMRRDGVTAAFLGAPLEQVDLDVGAFQARIGPGGTPTVMPLPAIGPERNRP